MSIFKLITREMWLRKWNVCLSLLGLILTLAFIISYYTTAEASKRETRRITRDIGFNLRIIPDSTDMDFFWFNGYSDQSMQEANLTRLATYENVFMTFNHLEARLQKRWSAQGVNALLTGLSQTIASEGKKPMGYRIQNGELIIGARIASELNWKKGDEVSLGEGSYKITEDLLESGTEEDIRIYCSLEDAQKLLGMPGEINEIQAIDCLCLTSDENPLNILRTELSKVLPDAKVLQAKSIADARARQRQLMDRYFAYTTPFLVVACAIWIGALAAMNVRERRSEIGMLRALGHGSGKIAALFLGKAMLIGALGAVLGFALGAWMSLSFGPGIFKITAKAIQPDYQLLLWSAVLAPLFSALATFIPASLAVAQDPATTLRAE
jgi:ABC-type lipoprotein release transport system permease subunit